MQLDETFKMAFKQVGGDPIKAMGYLGALTIWDRWNSEIKAEASHGSRNEFTVLPHLMSGVGSGDKTGQIYHFWGFVALIAANGPYFGAILGNTTTLGYEVVRSKIQQGFVDVEDFQVDNSAMAYAIGMHRILAAPPTVVDAQKQHKELMCKSKISQIAQTTDQDRRKCEIWISSADSMANAKTLIEGLKKQKPVHEIAFDDVGGCSIAAKQAPKNYSYVKTADGKIVNFSFMRYGGETSDQKTGLYSSQWIADGITGAKSPSYINETCKKANKVGGNCSALKQTIVTDLCPKPEEFKTCVSKNQQLLLKSSDYVTLINKGKCHLVAKTTNKIQAVLPQCLILGFTLVYSIFRSL